MIALICMEEVKQKYIRGNLQKNINSIKVIRSSIVGTDKLNKSLFMGIKSS